MYKVIIQSVNIHGPNEVYVEWEETITSKRSLRGAMSKATRWIKNNVFESDCDRIEKDAPLTEWSKQVTWRIY